jgi:chemotaxis protein MotB
MADEQRPIIIKRVKKVSGGAHGGAWKVAYADFVTAMMAFFMLLWLLNATTEEQKAGLAEYFTPTNASTNDDSGNDGVMGGTSMNPDGSQASAVTISIPQVKERLIKNDDAKQSSEEKTLEEEMALKEQQAFESLADDIRTSIQESPELEQMHDQIMVDITEDGMRIQIVDKDNRAMFKPNSAELYEYAKKMIAHIGKTIERVPNRLSITGHTDSVPARSKIYTNWELSSDRANAARRILTTSNIASDRYAEILGKAGTDPLLPDRPNRAENRRITILLLREATTLPSNFLD